MNGELSLLSGPDGQPVEWLPLTGSADLCAALPQRNFQMRPGRLGAHGDTGAVFYSPRETTVSVKVMFAKGTITEWYPHASAVQRTNTDGAIRWDAVRLMPRSHTVLPQADT
jgi:hypothetical protein